MAEDEVDALYALAPGEFTARRDALVKSLKADGRRDDAVAVAALRRPTVVAWAINQVARSRPAELADLVRAAAAVGAAQKALLDGGDAAGLRDATGVRQGAAAPVVEAAVALAGAGHADDVRHTLDAALADPELLDALRSGTLSQTLEAPSGFGFGLATDAPPVARRSRRPSSTARRPAPRTGGAGARRATGAAAGAGDDGVAPAEGAAEAKAREEQARREAQARREEELARAEEASVAAEQALAAADQARDEAQRRRDEVARSLAEAEAALEALRTAHDTAVRDHDDAVARAAEAEARRAEAVDALAEARRRAPGGRSSPRRRRS